MNTKHKLSSRIKVLSATLLMLLFSSQLYSQTYSIEEQELIDHITDCWDAWKEAKDANDPEIWYENCPSKPDASMWWTKDGAPEQVDRVTRKWDFVTALNEEWLDMRPVTIRIWDDVGMVQFYGYWLVDSKDGIARTEFKRTEVFKKESGTWILLGGQGTPVTQADAEPYK